MNREPLTRDFRETVKARAEADPAFRAALFIEALELMFEGDLATGKSVLRDYIKATIGFEILAEKTGTPSKSLMRIHFVPELSCNAKCYKKNLYRGLMK